MATKAEMSNDELIDAIPEDLESEGADTGEAAKQAADTGAAATTGKEEGAAAVEPAKTVPDKTTETTATGDAAATATGDGASSKEADNIRAARRGERLAIQKANRVQAELDRVLAERAPAPKVEKPTAEVLDDVRKYAPEVGEYVDRLEKQNEDLGKQVTPADKKPAFAPEVLTGDAAEEIQDAINEVDELAEWQMSEAHQDRWAAAKAQDAVLSNSPKWRNKPLTERFAHVVKKVNEEFDGAAADPAPAAKTTTTTATPAKKPAATPADAQRVIDENARAENVTIGDVRGRSPPTGVTSKRAAWASKTNDELLAELPED